MADATSLFNEISGALDGIAAQVMSLIGEDRSFMEMWGWNMPGIDRHDLADYIRRPKEVIQDISSKNVSDEDFQRLSQFPARIEFFRGNSLPNLPGGNAQNTYFALSGIIESLLQILTRYSSPPLDLQAVTESRILPAQQINALRKTARGVERLKVESESLEEKINEINSAHAVAQALPADMQTLDEARLQYEGAKGILDRNTAAILATSQDIENMRKSLSELKLEAAAVLKNANAAYGAATTVGLGKSFADRAKDLSRSTLVLGLMLLVTLSVGGWITFNRVEFAHKLMLQPNINYKILLLNISFTAVSVSAPVWLAWLLTRQIGQRFRLAEDYGYKASVAKAYEGYRAEAAHIDTDLAKRLFSIALDTLGEAPLRLVEKDSPGSPAHEIRGPLRRLFSPRTETRTAPPAD